MKICTKCHVEAYDGEFCTYCGAPLVVKHAVDAVKKCNVCHTEAYEGDFCVVCGAPLVDKQAGS